MPKPDKGIRNPVLDLKEDKMNRLFQEAMPDALYMNAYELADQFPSFGEDEWERFLDAPEVQRFMEAKMAKMMEVNARKALKRLGDPGEGGFGSQEVTALKEMIEKSKMIQSNQNRRPKVVLTFIPPRE